ncbi:hypothetical protein TIFTF001_032133 [Ficus carica]|uniref:Uncharacterized protein n=1 Tax=Ficus carica TaxID=3494 RepID=A0AA88J6B8_FICCA|nr:hypothetical protein TIFTF001_032133 [Ficus carica]
MQKEFGASEAHKRKRKAHSTPLHSRQINSRRPRSALGEHSREKRDERGRVSVKITAVGSLVSAHGSSPVTTLLASRTTTKEKKKKRGIKGVFELRSSRDACMEEAEIEGWGLGRAENREN